MACIALAYILMAYVAMAYIVMGAIGMTYYVVYVVMAIVLFIVPV